jgi:hypothetical protein
MTLSGRSSMVEAALTGTPILAAADSFFCASGLSGWPETGGYLISRVSPLRDLRIQFDESTVDELENYNRERQQNMKSGIQFHWIWLKK